MATIPFRPRPATGPELAEVLGGTFDFDNGTIYFEDSTRIRCTLRGAVILVVDNVDPYRPAHHHTLGMMSDGVGALAAEFVIAFERLRAGISPS